MKTKLQLRVQYAIEARRLYAIHIAVNTDATTDYEVLGYGETYDKASCFLKTHTIEETKEHYQTCLVHMENFPLQTELNKQYQLAMKQVLTDLNTLSEIPKTKINRLNKPFSSV